MRRGPFIALSVLLDALLINIGIVAAFFLRFGGTLPTFNFEPFIVLAPFITLLYLGCGYIYGLYEPERIENPWAVFRAAITTVTLGTALTSALLFFAGPGFLAFSRFVLLISLVVLTVLLTGWRVGFFRITSISWPSQRIVLVGTNGLAVELAEELVARSRWGYTLVGMVEADQENGRSLGCSPVSQSEDRFPRLGCLDDIGRIVEEHKVNRVIVVSPVALRDLIERLTLADEADIRVDVVPELYEIFIGKVDSLVGDIPLMEVTRSIQPRWTIALKRGLDVFGALTMLIALSPLLLLTALAVLLTMGWPVLYSQERMGRDMRVFRLYKFRTMINEAERESGPVLALASDVRVTPVGKVLRKYRIDELPQLVNILLGHMSFVGPRPERPFFVQRHIADIPGYKERFRIAPGVTGLAQVSGGYATTAERKLKYDLIYMYHHNLSMDLQIVLETLRVVLTGRGAR